MKIPSKIAIVALSLNLLLPTASFAQESSTGFESPRPEATGSPETHTTEASRSPRPSDASKNKHEDSAKFCTNVGTFRTNISGNTDKKVEKLIDNFNEHKTEISSKRAELINSLVEKRAKADAERAQRFKTLEAKAKTEAQTIAIKTYEATVLAAVAKHRAAIDAADKTFIDGVSAAVGSRQTDLSAAAAAYKTSVAAAFASANTSCAAGTAPKTVRETLSAALKSAQAKFVEARKVAEKARPNLDPLKATHRAAIKAADIEFRTSLKQAFSTLKAVISIKPTQSPSASPSPSTK